MEPANEVREAETRVGDCLAVELRLDLEERTVKRSGLPQGPGVIQVERIPVTECNAQLVFDVESGLPKLSGEIDPEVCYLMRIGEKVRGRDILRRRFNKAIRAMGPAPGCLSRRAGTLNCDNHLATLPVVS